MDKQLFRPKSMEQISSPEALHDYMRVTSPKLWMILGAIVVLLIGFIVYASTANLENTVPVRLSLRSAPAETGNDSSGSTWITGEIPASSSIVFQPGMAVRFGSQRGKIAEVHEAEGYFICTMENSYIPLPDGDYDAEVVTESRTPISFLWN